MQDPTIIPIPGCFLFENKAMLHSQIFSVTVKDNFACRKHVYCEHFQRNQIAHSPSLGLVDFTGEKRPLCGTKQVFS